MRFPFFETVLTVAIAVVMSVIAYVYLPGLYLSMRITKKQFLRTLPTALISIVIVITLFFLFNPQKLNLSDPLSYAWELIGSSMWIFIMDCRGYFLHFGKKNLRSTLEGVA
ncbi:hypothetical protein ACLIKE_03730 [Ferroplasma acidiphilum]|jgi:H+/Cl- antiporter ClcA|uniref:Uncharacterized protein n=2 Tax=Ferroplasma TaxID=74968 RepID=S0ANV6_FERAC|nr:MULTISPECIES: hypothetical protein [Ferroplasma]AGO60943.1 hypothetical protein FACI_IFERC00001G0963 [Ferroplasma acidarmanus Fer1]MCL4349500.1 hypothetical protein [Candidatus Thermoplasmatota archaeon]NOL61027.1 hypothetical protein [Ferroplasma acidiphilum]WMT52823.1 MAG: hypothetical protein RE473_07375 [Ferroplasma acidiphilum]